uniref:hypothetical protein n=1 Tax=Flavobacterium sp. TaxID=239 RepID=UPI00404B4B82
MKTKTTILNFLFIALLSTSMFAQDKTTVRASSSDISDNLDLRAIASIFGDAKDLEDFENKINNPEAQISNLDLNNDNYVDYLRVIESVEDNAHLIIIQSVLEKDTYQDIATIEVERDNNNNVQVQVVGNVYMYGENYIYEPVYVHRPIIYTSFWAPNYRPYYSNWNWNYYPTYYYAWNPFPIFRYRNHIALHINFGHSYHYANQRRCNRAYNMYNGRRSYAYETRYPNRSFSNRNQGYANRQELNNSRPDRNVRSRNEITRTNSSTRSSSRSPRESSTSRATTRSNTTTTRGNNSRATSTERTNSTRNTSSEPRTNTRKENISRENSKSRTNRDSTRNVKKSSSKSPSQTRTSSPRSSSNSRNSSNVRNGG